MPPDNPSISGYQSVWLFAMFDLPTKTKVERRRYTRFRNLLLDEGFSQMQYSVYARFCDSDATAKTYRKHLRKRLPDDGHVRLLTITDRQFEKMESFHGKKHVPTEEPPEQLVLF